MVKICIAIFYLSNFINLIHSIDSDGREFVTSFTSEYFGHHKPKVSLLIIPTIKTTQCTIKHHGTNQIISFTVNVIYRQLNDIHLPTYNITNYIANHISILEDSDPRILITCVHNVKILGKYYDINTKQGDIFLVPPITFAGKNYMVANTFSKNTFSNHLVILPLLGTNKIVVNISIYVEGTLYLTRKQTIQTRIGSKQYAIFAYNYQDSRLVNSTIIISSENAFMLSYVDHTTNREHIDHLIAGNTYDNNMLIQDYSCFHPMPSFKINSDDDKQSNDIRIITNDFSDRIYLSPFIKNGEYATSVVDVYDEKKYVFADYRYVDKHGFSNFDLNNTKESGFVSVYGPLSAFREGRIRNAKLKGGHFLSYVPSTKEYITGKTQFFSFQSGCVLEVFIELVRLNFNFIRLDNDRLVNFNYQFRNLKIFDHKYGRIEINVNGRGIHTFEANNRYTAFLICKNVNNPQNLFGYLIGMNKRKAAK